MADIHYERLTRTGARTGFAVAVRSRGSLWLGPDHLLYAETSGYTQSYKRFYFRDIQAILVQETKNYLWINVIFGFLALVFLIVIVAMMPKTAAGWNEDAIIGGSLLAFIPGLLLLILILNLIYGRTCKVFLRTAVQIERLTSLNRIRKTRKVLDKLRPLIAAAQGGELATETVTARMHEWAVSISGAAPAQTMVDDPNAPPRLRP